MSYSFMINGVINAVPGESRQKPLSPWISPEKVIQKTKNLNRRHDRKNEFRHR